MSFRKVRALVAVPAVTLAFVTSARLWPHAESRAFAPFVAESLPQFASGDFDGDGRSDAARIQDRDGATHVSVRLSGSPDDVWLDAAVAVLVDGDVDHDGDLDLVAATTTGDVVIWLNDGHGRFTRQLPARSRTLGQESTSIEVATNPPTAIGSPPVFSPSPDRSDEGVIVTRIRPPTVPIRFDRRRFLVLGLRAPPTLSV